MFLLPLHLNWSRPYQLLLMWRIFIKITQEMLEASHKAIADGTREYKDIAGTIKIMVSELHQAHQASIDTISRGVDEAVLSSMREAGKQLTIVQKAQADSLLTGITSLET